MFTSDRHANVIYNNLYENTHVEIWSSVGSFSEQTHTIGQMYMEIYWTTDSKSMDCFHFIAQTASIILGKLSTRLQ